MAVLERRRIADTRDDEDVRFVAPLKDLLRWPAMWGSANGESRTRLLRALLERVEVAPTRRLRGVRRGLSVPSHDPRGSSGFSCVAR